MDVYLKNRVDMAELTGSLARWYFEPATAAVRIRPGQDLICIGEIRHFLMRVFGQ